MGLLGGDLHIEDQVRGGAVGVGHFAKSGGGAIVDELGSAGVVITWEQDLLSGGAGLTNGGHGSLDGGGPLVDVDVMLNPISIEMD
jgi:hypothetical protein